MLREDLLKTVKRIELHSKKMVEEVLSGGFKTHFRGTGMQFSEHRNYVPGDDVRHIDWKASARSRETTVKKFEEERERSVLLMVDVSSSGEFGSLERTKQQVSVELAGILAYAAVQSGDKVGAILFSDQVEKMIPLKKGKNHVLRLIKDILSEKENFKKTQMSSALDAARRLQKHGGISFIISDFQDENYLSSLKNLSRKNDVVALWIQDEHEFEIPDVGFAEFYDPETGENILLDTGSYQFQKWIKEKRENEIDKKMEEFKKSQVEVISISPRSDYTEKLVQFFQKRKKRK